MAKEIELSGNAQTQYRKLVSYLIDNWSVATAEKFIDAFNQKLDLLTKFPEYGRRTKGNSRLRRLPIDKRNYLVYEVQSRKILVFGIYDNRQKNEW